MATLTGDKVQLTGKAFFARVHTPFQYDTEKKPTYSLSLVLTGTEMEKAKKLNLGITTSESIPEPHINLRTQIAPTVVDSRLNTIPKTTLIGNGSKVTVEGPVYTYKPKKKSQTGVGMGISGVQVLELVEFIPESRAQKVSFSEVASGYTTSNTMSSEDDDTSFT